MSALPFPGRSFCHASLALALAAAAPAVAQYPGGATVQALPGADDPAEKLAAALRTLAVSPRNLGALIDAGRNALTLGDPNAAVGFFGRASEVSPRDGRVKAGLGAALVQLEKPRDALRYFGEASALGVPDADLAEDRGLAYDLVGDPGHAQRDYQTVLAAHPDDDAVRRRLALSQGISGDRKAAIATLDPLIRKRDIAAWRAQTFVLAMTGDAKGANDITRVMLPQQQAMLQPFLERLAMLSPGDKARAVHFGEMPAAGRSYSGTQLASIGTPATYAPAPPPYKPTPAPAPVSAPVIARAAPAPVATAVPARPAPTAASTAPAVQPASKERFVSVTGVPLRRIEHTPQEMLALGMPRYEYVPISGASPTRAPAAQTAVAGALAAEPAPAAGTLITRSEAAAPGVAAASAGGSGIAGIEQAPPATVAVAAPPPVALTAMPAPVTGPAMPLGASGAVGHFDVPHEIADRRPVARVEQPTARPAPAPAPHVEPAPVLATPRTDAAPANPAVVAARQAHAGIEIAAADRPGRAAHSRSAPVVETVSAATAKDADARHGRPADAATEDDAAPAAHHADHAGPLRHDTATRTKRNEEDAASDRTGARSGARDDDAKGATKGHRDEEAAPVRKSTRSGDHDDRKAPTKAAKDDAPASDRKGRRDGAHPGAQDDEDASAVRPGKAHSRKRADDERASDKSSATKGDRNTDKPESDKRSASGGRIYVQVAGGANREDMDKAWSGVKAKAPELMKGHTPSTTPLKATNRLLVGPFKSDEEAQAFVNKMAGKGLSGFTFKSEKGQKIEKVGTAR